MVYIDRKDFYIYKLLYTVYSIIIHSMKLYTVYNYIQYIIIYTILVDYMK